MISQKHIRDSEHRYIKKINEFHFGQRIAGSGSGPLSVCDCIVVEEGQVYLTEIKATSQSRLVLTPKEIDRLALMIRAAEKNPPLKCRLVIHFKRRGWQTILLNSVGEIPTFFFFNNSTSYDLWNY